MIIYKDIVIDTRDELLSDSFIIKEINGILYEANCAMIDTDEDGNDLREEVNNIVHIFRLQPIDFDKASYQAYMKGYARKVLISLQTRNAPDEEVNTFKEGVQVYTRRILDSFNDWEFYTGESMDVDGMVVLLSYREDGITPFVTYWKHGLEEMKV